MLSIVFTYLLWSCEGMHFKLTYRDATSTCCRGWHFLVGPLKTFSALQNDFLSQYFTWYSLYLKQAESDWDDVNVTLPKRCLLFVCEQQTHRNCCLALSTTLHTASFPTGNHLWQHSSAWRIRANGNLFWRDQSSSNITNQSWKFFQHSSILYHGFLSLVLELKQDMDGRGRPGCVRGGISCPPSPTIPTVQHLKREECCGGADSNLTCQSQDKWPPTKGYL